MIDAKSGKLILDKGALLGYYQFFHDAVSGIPVRMVYH
jgi:hypothetical protein